MLLSSRSARKLCRIGLCLAAAASFVIGGTAKLYGCLWLYGTDPYGHSKTFNGGKFEGAEQLIYEAHQPRLNRSQSMRDGEYFRIKSKLKDHKQLNDFAVYLIRRGQTQRAIDILKSIEDKRPGDYATAANLGTAYELAGENKLALKWIKEAIDRNPGSHDGTEWVHVRILEAKLKLAEDPKWLESRGVLALDFGQNLIPHAPPAIVDDLGNKHDAEDVEKAIRHQLHERIPLVPPPAPIVGDLLADLGTLILLKGVIEKALPVYDLALEYRMPKRELALKRIEHFKQLVAANPASLKPSSSENQRRESTTSGTLHDGETAIAVAIAVAVIALLVFVLLAFAFANRPRKSETSEVSSLGPKE